MSSLSLTPRCTLDKLWRNWQAQARLSVGAFVRVFVADQCVLGPGCRCPDYALYQAARTWAYAKGHLPPERAEFCASVARGRGVRYEEGVFYGIDRRFWHG